MKTPAISLEGKIALVTGAAGGLGAATAELLGSAGAKVFLTDLLPRRGG
jgi:NAD(P)-dependent dehydrogenase (short-subunit alcohol dehydrogenase family)